MPIKKILKLGNEKLSQPSAPIEQPFESIKNLNSLINDMKDTMYEKGGVGIAAPQIGSNTRIIMFGFDKSNRYPNEKSVPFTILINPKIKILTDELVDGWEGCLSVPGLRGLVSRYNEIEYSGYNENGFFISRKAEGFHARVVQHECDHLDGILFPQKLKDIRHFGFEDELFTG